MSNDLNFEQLFDRIKKSARLTYCFSLFKTNKWEKFNEVDKIRCFVKINKQLNDLTHMDGYGIYMEYDGIKKETISDSSYVNVLLTENNEFKINEINNNQYQILFDYLVLYAQEFIKNSYVLGEKYLDSIYDYVQEDFAMRIEDYLRYDMHEYKEDVLAAKEFAFKVVSFILKKNYEPSDSLDEETFLIDPHFTFNQDLYKEVIDLNKDRVNNYKEDKKNIEEIYDIVETIKDNDDMKSMPNKYLFLFAYPFIYKEIDTDKKIDIYNELAKRLIKKEINIVKKKGFVYFNNHRYTVKEFNDNCFNIFLKEGLNLHYEEMKNYTGEYTRQAIKENGKRWALSVMIEIDAELSTYDFGSLKYKPLEELYSSKKMDEYKGKNEYGKKVKR